MFPSHSSGILLVMATKKPTTNAKTKTSKSKSTNKIAAAKTRAAKTTAKAPEKTTKVVKSAKVTIPKLTGASASVMGLRRLHMVAAGLFVVLAIAAGVLMGNDSYQLTVGHLAKDALASGEVLVPATKAVYDIEIRWMVVGLLVLSAVLPVLYVTKLEDRYNAYVRNTRMMPYRWIDLAVTGAVMMQIVALLSGVSDIFTLKALGGLVALSFVLSLIAERQNNTSDKVVWSAYVAGIFSGVLPWLFIAGYAVSSVVFGSVASPWYVYALYGVGVASFTLLMIKQCKAYRRKSAAQNYLAVERNYVVISLLTKVAFAAALIVGLS